MFQVNLSETANRKLLSHEGPYQVFEYERDLSVSPEQAIQAYYASEMNIRKRQVFITLNGTGVVVQAGAMQWMTGNIKAQTNVRGAGDFFKKIVGASVTKESAIKPLYQGHGQLVLEPTYKHILIERVDNWGGLVVEDGLFLACDSTVDTRVVSRTSLSSAVAGSEGLFNTCLSGSGYVVLESNYPSAKNKECARKKDTCFCRYPFLLKDKSLNHYWLAVVIFGNLYSIPWVTCVNDLSSTYVNSYMANSLS